MLIRDIDDMSTKDYLDVMIKYLQVLQDGRCKPDNSGGYIRESLYNIKEIDEVKFKINDILRTEPKRKEISATFKF